MGEGGELYKRRHRPRELSDVATVTAEAGNGCEYSGGRLTLPGLTIKSFAPTSLCIAVVRFLEYEIHTDICLTLQVTCQVLHLLESN